MPGRVSAEPCPGTPPSPFLTANCFPGNKDSFFSNLQFFNDTKLNLRLNEAPPTPPLLTPSPFTWKNVLWACSHLPIVTIMKIESCAAPSQPLSPEMQFPITSLRVTASSRPSINPSRCPGTGSRSLGTGKQGWERHLTFIYFVLFKKNCCTFGTGKFPS